MVIFGLGEKIQGICDVHASREFLGTPARDGEKLSSIFGSPFLPKLSILHGHRQIKERGRRNLRDLTSAKPGLSLKATPEVDWDGQKNIIHDFKWLSFINLRAFGNGYAIHPGNTSVQGVFAFFRSHGDYVTFVWVITCLKYCWKKVLNLDRVRLYLGISIFWVGRVGL